MMEALAAEEDRVPAYPVQNADRRPPPRGGRAGRTSHLSLWAGQGVGAARPVPAARLMALLAQSGGWLQPRLQQIKAVIASRTNAL